MGASRRGPNVTEEGRENAWAPFRGWRPPSGSPDDEAKARAAGMAGRKQAVTTSSHRPPLVRMHSQDLTYFPKSVFDGVFLQTHQRHTALVYAVMYDRAWHSKKKTFRANRSDLAKWTGRDFGTVTACLRELQWKGFVACKHKGIRRSRSDKPVWRVPHASFDMGHEGWVPVPRFLVAEYLPQYPNAVLLLELLYFQSMRNLNWTWVSVWRLYLQLHCWSKNRIRNALATMGNQEKWSRLHTDLPQPLLRARVVDGQDHWSWRYHVRCLVFRQSKSQSKRRVYLHPLFAKRFGIAAEPPRPEDVALAETPQASQGIAEIAGSTLRKSRG